MEEASVAHFRVELAPKACMVGRSSALLMEVVRGVLSPTAPRVLEGVLIIALDMAVASVANLRAAIKAHKGAPISARHMAAASDAHGANQVQIMVLVPLLVAGLHGEKLASVAYMLRWCKTVAFMEAAQ